MLPSQSTAMVSACQHATAADVKQLFISFALSVNVAKDLGCIEVCKIKLLPATARSLRLDAQTSIWQPDDIRMLSVNT